MKIDRIELRLIEIPLKEPFEIASHRFLSKTALILKAWANEGIIGWAEGEHLGTPWYVPETVESGWAILSSLLLPGLIHREFSSAQEVKQLFSWIQGNQLSLAAVDVLVWDLISRANGISIAHALGGRRDRVPVGTSLGLCSSPDQLLERVSAAVGEGYQRIKVKIKPGKDFAYVEKIRQDYPTLPLMVDANSSYSPVDENKLQALDGFHLIMIEQPYENGDLVHHAGLAARLTTPICLDESIHTIHEARAAVALGACQIVNIKPPRIGGPSAVLDMETFLRGQGIAVWCGGMLETGIGRAVNLACASLEGFCLPGDLAAPGEYLERDIIAEHFTLASDGTMLVPDQPGIGVQVDEEYLDHCTSRLEVFQ
jgi:O-succinylbenzoate synthase